MIIELCIEEGDELKFAAMPKYGKDPVQITVQYHEYGDELQIAVSGKNGKVIDHTTVMLSRIEE